MNTIAKGELYDLLNEMAKNAIKYYNNKAEESGYTSSEELVVTGIILRLKYIVEDRYSDDMTFSQDDVNKFINSASNQRENELKESDFDLREAVNVMKTFDYILNKINEVFDSRKQLDALQKIIETSDLANPSEDVENAVQALLNLESHYNAIYDGTVVSDHIDKLSEEALDRREAEYGADEKRAPSKRTTIERD